MQTATEESEFLEAILSGGRQHAFAVAQRHFHEQGLASLYEEVVTPALRQLGRLWERNIISVADEHLATAITQSVIAALYPELTWPPATFPAVVACVEGERHEVGARMAADLLELDGWQVVYMGSDTPTSALLAICQRIKPILVGISVGMSAHLVTARDTIAALRARLGPVKILVGGRAGSSAAAAAVLGADATAESASAAVAIASQWKRSLLAANE